jgi:hypothetical protein
LLNALSSSVQLQLDVQQYRRDEHLPYEGLLDILRRQVARIEQSRNQAVWLRSVQAPALPMAAPAAPVSSTPVACAFYAEGRCNRGSHCRFSHALPAVPAYHPPPPRQRPNAVAPIADPKAARAPEAPKSGCPSPAAPKRPCYRFVDGQPCDAASCRFEHRALTAEEARSRAASQEASTRGVCLQFQSRGSCRFGSECRYRHGAGPSAATPPPPRESTPPASSGSQNRSPSRRGKGKGRSSSRAPAPPT